MYHNFKRGDSIEYKKFVKSVFERDHYKCVIFKKRKKINAHHLNGWHWYPHGRFNPDNAVTLCAGRNSCHALFHQMFDNKNNTKQQFDQFACFQKTRLQGQNRGKK